jgi:hypothetical protein
MGIGKDLSDTPFFSLKAYSEHPEVVVAAERLVTSYQSTLSRKLNTKLYLRDAKKLIASVWLHEGNFFRATTKTVYYSKAQRKQVWMTNRVLSLFKHMLSGMNPPWVRLRKKAIPPYASKSSYGYSSIYEPTGYFFRYLNSVTYRDIFPNPDAPDVLFRDENKVLIEQPKEFYESDQYKKLSGILEAQLSLLTKEEVIDGDGNYVGPFDLKLTRIFTGKIGKGGRFYCAFQNKRKVERLACKIGGQEVISMDISFCHPMLMLRIGWKQTDERGLFGLRTKDPYDMEGYGGLPREVTKRAINVLFNADSLTSAHNALKNIYWDIDETDGEVWVRVFNSRQKRFGIKAFRDKKDQENFIEQFKFLHHRFKNFICTGIGLEMQWLDSVLTSYLIEACNQNNLPMIPIHEEYLIKKNDKERFKKIFIDVFKNQIDPGVGGDLIVKWSTKQKEVRESLVIE